MILASNNQGKIEEFRKIFGDNIKGLKEASILVDVEENGATFFENAAKKAKEIFNISKEPVIADDSGLCISELDDFPGVLTHRFLGENSTDKERNEYLVEKLKGKKNRTARFICCLVYYDGKNLLSAEGILNGKIADFPRGENGFGFDSIFELTNGKTLAEIDSNEKNKISARYLAALDLKYKISKI